MIFVFSGYGPARPRFIRGSPGEEGAKGGFKNRVAGGCPALHAVSVFVLFHVLR